MVAYSNFHSFFIDSVRTCHVHSPPSFTLCFLGPSKPIWSRKTFLRGLHTFWCLAVPLLEIAKDHIRACTPISSPHRRWEFSIFDDTFKLQWWALFSSGVISLHPSTSADMGAPSYLGPEDSQLKIIEYGMVWVKRDFKDYLVPTPNLVQPTVKQSHFHHFFNFFFFFKQ